MTPRITFASIDQIETDADEDQAIMEIGTFQGIE